MVFMKNIISLAILLTSAFASDVVQLTDKTFKDFVSNHDVVMAEFYAPWCGHCQALAPEYEEAATALKEKDLYIAKIDCTEEDALCADQQIHGYPTLKIFHGLEKSFPYTGSRKADSIISHMVRHSLPTVSSVNKDNIETFVESDSYVVIGFFNDKTSNSTFGEIADSLRDKYVFGASNDEELAKKYGLTSLPGLVAFKNVASEQEVATFSKDFVTDEVLQWVNQESFPLIGEIGPATFGEYTSSGLPLLYVFAESDEDKEELSSLIKPYAEKLKGKLLVGTLDAKKFGRHAGNVNLREEFPALAIEDFVTNKKYVHSQDEAITKKSVKKFLDSFAAGTLEASFKSEDIPETQEGPVYKIVGKNYDEIVLDDDKDVLVEFYAPWCGHCKRLAPIYEELGALYFNDAEFADKVAIAQVDHTANEVPVDIAGYPTIKLFAAGKKDTPFEFESARTLEELADFIKNKGTHKVDALSKRKEAEEDDSEESETDNIDSSSTKSKKAEQTRSVKDEL